MQNPQAASEVHIGYPLYLVHSSTDDEWYRAEVTGLNQEDNTFFVYFVDYGFSEVVNPENIFNCNEELQNIPHICYSCVLSTYVTGCPDLLQLYQDQPLIVIIEGVTGLQQHVVNLSLDGTDVLKAQLNNNNSSGAEDLNADVVLETLDADLQENVALNTEQNVDALQTGRDNVVIVQETDASAANTMAANDKNTDYIKATHNAITIMTTEVVAQTDNVPMEIVAQTDNVPVEIVTQTDYVQIETQPTNAIEEHYPLIMGETVYITNSSEDNSAVYVYLQRDADTDNLSFINDTIVNTLKQVDFI